MVDQDLTTFALHPWGEGDWLSSNNRWYRVDSRVYENIIRTSGHDVGGASSHEQSFHNALRREGVFVSADVIYGWPVLSPEAVPSAALRAAVAAIDDVTFWSACIEARRAQERWKTLSRLEVGYDRQAGRARVFWKSGISFDHKSAPKDLADNYLSEWLFCSSPQEALDRVTQQQEAQGWPIVGVSMIAHPSVSYYPPIPIVY